MWSQRMIELGQSVLCSKSIVILQRKGDGRSTEFNFKGQVSRRYKLTERPQVKVPHANLQ
jgi:hypothetical protein